jgi:uncharacterized FlgJ-related protein
MNIIITEDQFNKVISSQLTNPQQKISQDKTRVDNSVRNATIKKVLNKDGTPELEFTPQLFVKKVKESGITYPDVAIAQSLWETGYFKSDVFLNNNNLFGMRHPGKRETTSIGKSLNHAKYNNWLDSIADYKLWEKDWGMDKLPRDQYINKLNRVYCFPPECKEGQYSKNILSIMGKATKLLNSTT